MKEQWTANVHNTGSLSSVIPVYPTGCANRLRSAGNWVELLAPTYPMGIVWNVSEHMSSVCCKHRASVGFPVRRISVSSGTRASRHESLYVGVGVGWRLGTEPRCRGVTSIMTREIVSSIFLDTRLDGPHSQVTHDVKRNPALSGIENPLQSVASHSIGWDVQVETKCIYPIVRTVLDSESDVYECRYLLIASQQGCYKST